MSLQQELHYGHFIDGQDYLGHTPESIDVINPANGEVYATMSMGDKGDVDAAVAAACLLYTSPSPRDS